MSIKALSDYTLYARYAKYNESEQRRETWVETVNRVFNMHERKYKTQLDNSEELRGYFAEAKLGLLEKRILGSQRALQFGGNPIERKNAKLFNCAFGHVCYDRVFNEIMHLLLCGCGVGFSVQKHHVKQLSNLIRIKPDAELVVYKPEDSIEGWADCVAVLMSSYFETPLEGFEEYQGKRIDFDLSLIRPEGSNIDGGFKAPGPSGLLASLNKIENLLIDVTDNAFFGVGEYANKLRPIDAYDIIMHLSDAVLSGGVRRSATICLFSLDDTHMMDAKTGNWFNENPQRGRSNNSAVLVRSKSTKEEFMEVKQRVKEFGEPAFVFVDDEECGVNPCCEIVFRPITEDGRHGFQFCNLSTVNGKFATNEEKFLRASREASIIGTIQAGYTDFSYVGNTTKELTEGEALLGVSITGVMDSPEITLDAEIQRKGARVVLDTNKRVAELLGINPAARATCVKPEGSASCVLGTSSGIHPHHAKRYFRRVQANKMEYPVQYFSMFNPQAIEESVWSANKTDEVITFLCEVPKGSITKNQLNAIELLDNVKLTQQNWVESGTVPERGNKSYLRHNVSNTISVGDDEWDEVFEYLWENKDCFTGVSMVSTSGDKDYPQAPFCTVYTPKEIVSEYGDASMFASGMITASLEAFDNNLWSACSHALGIEQLNGEVDEAYKLFTDQELTLTDIRSRANSTVNQAEYEELEAVIEQMEVIVIKLDEQYLNTLEKYETKQDWLRRAQQFADRYFDGDVRRMTYCLKDVYNFKVWVDLKRDYREIDWSKAYEEREVSVAADTMAAASCAGGACEIT